MATRQPVEKRQNGDTAIFGTGTGLSEIDWPEKIAKAIEARRAGQEARKGKPVALGLERSHIVDHFGHG